MSLDNLPASEPLRAAAAVAEETYRAANPKSAEQYEKAGLALPAGNTRTSLFYGPFPLTMARGEDTRLWDLDGHEYTNFLSEFTSGIYGHSHPRIIAELKSALSAGLNLSSHTEGEANLAAAICERFPCFDKVRLTNSGTEANTMALVAARMFTGRDKVVVFKGGYHGGPLTFVGGASRANVPFDFLYGQYNDLNATLAEITPHADEVACILVEAVLGAGGCIPGDRDFLHGLQEWCQKNGALFILDEVQTSRHHACGLQENLGLKADLTTMGKFIGGCMPIGVFGGRDDIMDMFDPSKPGSVSHSGTFNNNVMTMRAGLVGLTEVYTRDEAERLTQMGDAFRDRLNAIIAEFDAPFHVTGIGSIMNIHGQSGPITRADQVQNECSALKDLLFFELLTRNIYFAKRGLVALNLCHTQSDLDRFEEGLREILMKHQSLWRNTEG
ncbi:aminotransferase class III-fold pyridoxal phosphate-dependent enzyme [Phaeobacter sp. J2-8]|uniref:aspartate aminotransferase family protein n=1 Tax=Phaeobacter sp. J2-8 TaxID=2931394 RepID=UPI001FD3D2DF|nr:aminotransferase class III-fold pyridoxal phosphate-dependent enzyme [Phaeobacter sp. J2-8]MCJ7871293.1 aminotransferase class III-fold pyridoxal phosphate-dependent enzyme [Phaeobacter sp. J2-8]